MINRKQAFDKAIARVDELNCEELLIKEAMAHTLTKMRDYFVQHPEINVDFDRIFSENLYGDNGVEPLKLFYMTPELIDQYPSMQYSIGAFNKYGNYITIKNNYNLIDSTTLCHEMIHFIVCSSGIDYTEQWIEYINNEPHPRYRWYNEMMTDSLANIIMGADQYNNGYVELKELRQWINEELAPLKFKDFMEGTGIKKIPIYGPIMFQLDILSDIYDYDDLSQAHQYLMEFKHAKLLQYNQIYNIDDVRSMLSILIRAEIKLPNICNLKDENEAVDNMYLRCIKSACHIKSNEPINDNFRNKVLYNIHEIINNQNYKNRYFKDFDDFATITDSKTEYYIGIKDGELSFFCPPYTLNEELINPPIQKIKSNNNNYNNIILDTKTGEIISQEYDYTLKPDTFNIKIGKFTIQYNSETKEFHTMNTDLKCSQYLIEIKNYKQKLIQCIEHEYGKQLSMPCKKSQTQTFKNLKNFDILKENLKTIANDVGSSITTKNTHSSSEDTLINSHNFKKQKATTQKLDKVFIYITTKDNKTINLGKYTYDTEKQDYKLELDYSLIWDQLSDQAKETILENNANLDYSNQTENENKQNLNNTILKENQAVNNMNKDKIGQNKINTKTR